MKKKINLILVLFITCFSVFGQLKNKPQLDEDFMDMGFGIFVHWSMDSQLGSVISHSLVGASDNYVNKYFNELPKTFYPDKFDAEEWARLFKISGAEYVVFTAKHHNGFCMWDTKTTDFNIMNTPYGKDIVAELVTALRKYDLKVGIYFSPEDFSFIHKQGHLISRKGPMTQIGANKELFEYDKAQVRELINNYGPIDVMFFDAFQSKPMAQYVHKIAPEIVVTRGEMKTPEQSIPGGAMPGPWETCMTMGTQWQYKPTNDVYKDGSELIEKLIEIRAKGGNFLMNIGPKPNGEIPKEQEERLREIALWMYVNEEGVKNVRTVPTIIKDGDMWFTKGKDDKTAYVFITGQKNWFKGGRRNFLLKNMRATSKTTASVLGQNDLVVEYWPENLPTTRYIQHKELLEISVSRAQRLYNNKIWHNPIVVKLTDVEFIK
ncbi:alpha-L-fucosidase [Polaribacter sejongensis]|uniref:alpha-L-fucosidase n=2 Tax=Polaribacter sejongensis TaxID=985043 RepID=A0AAJ1QZS3_9FLAO|nr:MULTISPECIES: alpha-L-fucosidase [Polaribacter]AUC21061.1 alpha-L-fucosidase [Polaribacter sejongensis]MDN3620777.1 alpha-L-fucosidase [Polaribacter undariae]UWD31376.1 alpha-L-fucosidase [Polaribacter undariae]